MHLCLCYTNIKTLMLFQVTRQLFEPLVMQLIHWFTNNRKFESQDTVAVLEAILVNKSSPHQFVFHILHVMCDGL